MLAFVAKQSDEFNQIQVSVSLAAGFPVQLLEAYRYATVQAASFQFYVNQTYLSQFIALDKVRLNEHVHMDTSLLLTDGQITMQESHGTFVLFTLRAGVVLPYSSRVKQGQYTVKLCDLVPVYLVQVLRPGSELQFEYSLPQILYKNRQADVMSVPANQMKLQALNMDSNRLREAQAVIWREAERVEQQLYKEFKQNVLRVQQVAQFGINTIQTEMSKNEAHMARITRVLKALEETTQGASGSMSVQQLKILNAQPQQRGQSTLFDISRQSLLQVEQFQALIEGHITVADRITPELQVQFRQQLPQLEKDARIYMDKQLQAEQLDHNIKETRRIQDVLQSSVALRETLEKHNPDLVQSAAQYLAVGHVKPMHTNGQQMVSQIDIFDHQQMYAADMNEPNPAIAAGMTSEYQGKQLDIAPNQRWEDDHYQQPMISAAPGAMRTIQRQIPVNLAGLAIERKAAMVNKRFPMIFDFAAIGEAFKDIPIAAVELQFPAFLNLLSYHFCKFKQLETVRPISFHRRQSFVGTQQVVFVWNCIQEKLLCLLSVLTSDGRTILSCLYDLVEGLFIQNDQTSIKQNEIQTKDFTLTDKTVRDSAGQSWPVEGMIVFEVE